LLLGSNDNNAYLLNMNCNSREMNCSNHYLHDYVNKYVNLNQIKCMKLSYDNTLIALGSDNIIKIFDLKTSKIIKSFTYISNNYI